MSSVIMSAYDTSHRSWFSCSSSWAACFFLPCPPALCPLTAVACWSRRASGGLFLRLRGARAEEAAQLLRDQARVRARLDVDDAGDDHLHLAALDLGDPLEPVADRQPHHVRAEDAPQR